MKRRIRTSIEFKFDDVIPFGTQTNFRSELVGTRGKNFYLTEVIAYTEQRPREGSIRFHLDVSNKPQYYNFSTDPGRIGIVKLFRIWYENEVSAGEAGTGTDFFTVSFRLKPEEEFCEAVVGKIISMLADLGVSKEQIPYPSIVQVTEVLVDHMYIPYGTVLGKQFELGGHNAWKNFH